MADLDALRLAGGAGCEDDVGGLLRSDGHRCVEGLGAPCLLKGVHDKVHTGLLEGGGAPGLRVRCGHRDVDGSCGKDTKDGNDLLGATGQRDTDDIAVHDTAPTQPRRGAQGAIGDLTIGESGAVTCE